MIPHQDRRRAVRFLILGVGNTVASYAVFILLGLFILPSVAFTIAYALGLILVVFGSSSWVFKAERDPWRLIAFAAVYLGLFGLGQLVIGLVQPRGFVELAIVSVAIASVSVPTSFLSGRVIFSERRGPGSHKMKESNEDG